MNTLENKLESLISLASDNISQLRRLDVYRVLEAADNQYLMSEMAEYLEQNRPDLSFEINDCMMDIVQVNASLVRIGFADFAN
jgi:hypothetical protein